MKKAKDIKKKELGPSKPSKVNDNQEEWQTVTSDDEEAYVNEMTQLYKD